MTIQWLTRSTTAALVALALWLNAGCPPVDGTDDAGAQPDANATDASATDSGTLDSASGETGTISGRVTDVQDRGVGDALVSVGSLNTRADYQGNYTLSGVPAGSATVAVSAPWFVDGQAATSVTAGGSVTVNVQLDARPLQVLADDLTLTTTYNASFDWTQDSVSVSHVAAPTRAAFDRALYLRNPALYRDVTGEPTVTPAALPTINGGAQNFDFPIQSGAPHQNEQALDVASIVDAIADTPLTTAEQAASVAWEPAVDIFLVDWDIAKSIDLYYVSLAIRGQRWGGSSTVPPQSLQHAYLHNGELWVELAFEDYIDLGSGITDDDGDGYREVYARVPTAFYTTEVYNKLRDDYLVPTFDTLGLRDNLSVILDDLYTRTSPSVVSVIGVPYTLPGGGTLQYPFVVLRHSDGVVNVFLVEP